MTFDLHSGLIPALAQVALPQGTVLGAAFFARSSNEVAPDLIGKILWSPGVGGGRLTEVEAYLPAGDPASHAACGPTRRNAAMFGPPGTIYVFLSYGMHYLVNLVCDREGVGSAVLIRALEAFYPHPGAAAEEADVAEEANVPKASPKRYCGPGRVGVALRIQPGLNGVLLGQASGLFVVDDGFKAEVGVDSRIGISRGAALPLRYYARGSECVTRRSATRGGPCA
jgi:DNA-3-methyladenine glycosylase